MNLKLKSKTQILGQSFLSITGTLSLFGFFHFYNEAASVIIYDAISFSLMAQILLVRKWSHYDVI